MYHPLVPAQAHNHFERNIYYNAQSRIPNPSRIKKMYVTLCKRHPLAYPSIVFAVYVLAPSRPACLTPFVYKQTSCNLKVHSTQATLFYATSRFLKSLRYRKALETLPYKKSRYAHIKPPYNLKQCSYCKVIKASGLTATCSNIYAENMYAR